MAGSQSGIVRWVKVVIELDQSAQSDSVYITTFGRKRSSNRSAGLRMACRRFYWCTLVGVQSC